MYVLVCTGMYWYVPYIVACQQYIIVCTGTYCYVLLYIWLCGPCSQYDWHWEYPSFPFFLMVTLHLQSHTFSASTRGLASPWAAPTQMQQCVWGQHLALDIWALQAPRLGGLTVGATAQKKALCESNKPSVQQRLVGVGKLLEQLQNEACVVDVHTCTYQLYIPVCTYLYLHYLNFAFLKFNCIL